MNGNIFQWITVNDLFASPPAPVKFLWGDRSNGLMQECSYTMFHSSEKQGKSMLLLNLAVAGARGDSEFLGLPLRRGGFRTMILQNEVHMRAMYERFRRMTENGAWDEEAASRITLNSYRAVTLTNPILFYWFRRKIRAWKPDLVVIDPLAHMLTEDENSNVAVGKGLAPLLKLRDDPGIAVAVVHHDGKVSDSNAGRPAQQRSRGANRLTADADGIVSLTPMRRAGGPTSRLSCTPRYGGHMEPFRVRLNERTFWFERYSTEQEQGEQLQDILRGEATLRMDEATLVELAAEAWGSKDEAHGHRTVKKRIERAVKDGLIYRHDINGVIVYEAPPLSRTEEAA